MYKWIISAACVEFPPDTSADYLIEHLQPFRIDCRYHLPEISTWNVFDDQYTIAA